MVSDLPDLSDKEFILEGEGHIDPLTVSCSMVLRTVFEVEESDNKRFIIPKTHPLMTADHFKMLDYILPDFLGELDMLKNEWIYKRIIEYRDTGERPPNMYINHPYRDIKFMTLNSLSALKLYTPRQLQNFMAFLDYLYIVPEPKITKCVGGKIVRDNEKSFLEQAILRFFMEDESDDDSLVSQ